MLSVTFNLVHVIAFLSARYYCWKLIPYTYVPRPGAKNRTLCGARRTEFARMELVLENVLAKDTRGVTYPSVTLLPECTPMTLMVSCGSAESIVNRLGFCVNTALRTAPIG